MRTEAMGLFVTDVHQGDYPAPQFLVDYDTTIVEAFHAWLDRNA